MVLEAVPSLGSCLVGERASWSSIEYSLMWKPHRKEGQSPNRQGILRKEKCGQEKGKHGRGNSVGFSGSKSIIETKTSHGRHGLPFKSLLNMMVVFVLFVFGLILGSPHGFQVLDVCAFDLSSTSSQSTSKPKEVREVMGVARSATCPDKRLTTTRTG